MRGREADLDAALEPAVARRLQSRGAIDRAGAADRRGERPSVGRARDPARRAGSVQRVRAPAAAPRRRPGGARRLARRHGRRHRPARAARRRRRGALGDRGRRGRRARRRAPRERRLPRRQRAPARVDENGLHVLAGFGARLADPLRQGPLDALALEALRHDDAIVTGGDGSAALAGGSGSGAVLSVVLRARGEALGVLQLLFAERERADAAASDVALTVFATRVAEALEAARAQRRLAVDLADARALCDAVAPAGEPSTQRALEAALRLTGLTRGRRLGACRRRLAARGRERRGRRRPRPRSSRRCSTRPAARPRCAATSPPTRASRRSRAPSTPAARSSSRSPCATSTSACSPCSRRPRARRRARPRWRCASPA